MESTVEVKDRVVTVLTSMTCSRTGGGTGEHKLQSWIGSVLTANSVTSLGVAQGAEKPTKNERRRLSKAG